MVISSTYFENVFINCPFDKQYEPLFQAITFTVYHCGFVAKCALSEDDSSQLRLKKILRLIEDCKYGIHDISRTELDLVNKLPRFNMPFEMGLFFACKEFGNKTHKNKVALVLDHSAYRYQKFISDLNGVDPKAHANDEQNSAAIAIRHPAIKSICFSLPWFLTRIEKENLKTFLGL